MENKQKNMLIQIAISSIFFVTALILNYFNFFKNSNITIFCLVIAYFTSGHMIFIKTIKNTIKLNLLDENFLMCIATLGAFLLKEYFEAVAITLFYQIGEFFQKVAIKKSENSIANLLNLQPKKINIKNNEQIITTKPESVKIGSIIVVKPGEQIPIDGKIVSGTSQINTSSITGESKTMTAKPGDNVISGYINLTAILEIRTTTIFQNSTIKKMINLIENAKQKKAKSEKFITKFAKIYTPIIVFIALILAIVPTIFLNQNVKLWLQNAIVLISISCPCALVISIPLSFFGAITNSAKNSILIKTSQTIEKINKIKTIIFDKTGTLTNGKFEIVEINPKNVDKNELINLLTTAESLTNHPIATAINEKFKNLKLKNKIKTIKCEEIAGLGIKTTTNTSVIYVGNEKLMNKFNISFEKINKIGTIIYVAKNETYAGNIVVSDKTKNKAKKVVEKLRKLNFQNIVMMTGDNKTISHEVAKSLKLDSYFANQLPIEKANKIKKIQTTNPVIFVGDGINDAPALVTAEVGIAMGKFGSDIAMDSADIILVDGDLNKIIKIIKIAKKTMKIVKQNLFFSVLIKILILTAGIAGNANIWLAIFSDVGVSILAVANALRTLKI